MKEKILDKDGVCQRLDMVCKTLDGGITVSGAQNAGNLAGCFAILQDVLSFLATCEIIVPGEEKSKTDS